MTESDEKITQTSVSYWIKNHVRRTSEHIVYIFIYVYIYRYLYIYRYPLNKTHGLKNIKFAGEKCVKLLVIVSYF